MAVRFFSYIHFTFHNHIPVRNTRNTVNQMLPMFEPSHSYTHFNIRHTFHIKMPPTFLKHFLSKISSHIPWTISPIFTTYCNQTLHCTMSVCQYPISENISSIHTCSVKPLINCVHLPSPVHHPFTTFQPLLCSPPPFNYYSTPFHHISTLTISVWCVSQISPTSLQTPLLTLVSIFTTVIMLS